MQRTSLVVLLLAGIFSLAAPAQNNTAFPTNFIGDWKGKLQWTVAGKPPQWFSMQLRIHPADTMGQYTWQIIYGDSGTDNRPYLLKPVDTARGHWVIDEQNGIVLDNYVHGNALHGAFTVQGNTIVDDYRLDNNRLWVTFLSIRLGDKTATGKGTQDIPFVDSYRIGSYQWGYLERLP